MGAVSIVLNIFTLIVVALVFYITYLAFGSRQNRDETWIQTFKRTFSSEMGINNALTKKENSTPTSFIGQDWSVTPTADYLFGYGLSSVQIVDADKQDSLVEFMDSRTPIKYGTSFGQNAVYNRDG
jgi:hypothetical protein